MLPSSVVTDGLTGAIEQAERWSSAIADVVHEMEEAFGEPGENYPAPVNMAAYLAFRECRLYIDELRTARHFAEQNAANRRAMGVRG